MLAWYPHLDSAEAELKDAERDLVEGECVFLDPRIPVKSRIYQSGTRSDRRASDRCAAQMAAPTACQRRWGPRLVQLLENRMGVPRGAPAQVHQQLKFSMQLLRV